MYDLLIALLLLGISLLFIFLKRPKYSLGHMKELASRVTVNRRNIIEIIRHSTGTAECLAHILGSELRSNGFKILVVSTDAVEECLLKELCSTGPRVVVLVLATYGEGEPPDSAHEFVELLKHTKLELVGLKYAIFGLGNSMYTHFNACAKIVDHQLQNLGASRYLNTTLGDELQCMELQFSNWRKSLILQLHKDCPRVGQQMNCRNRRMYMLETKIPNTSLYTGEPWHLNSYATQQPPFDARNPFLAHVMVNRKLYQCGPRSCHHIELDITGSQFHYKTGDHIGLIVPNPSELVCHLGFILGMDLDQIISLTCIEPLTERIHPFPCPCTYRTAFTFYVDISGPPPMRLFSMCSDYAANLPDRSFLRALIEENLYERWILHEHRNLVNVLMDLASFRPPADLLLELLNPLKPRYYSISSSNLLNPNHVHLTVSVVNYKTPIGRQFKGLASYWLANRIPISQSPHIHVAQNHDSKVPIFMHRSSFHLPRSSSVPIIMVAAGTGIAPFRAFIQERCYLAKTAGRTVGCMILFYGFRNQSEDYLYADELQMACHTGLLELVIAASRSNNETKKVYVQDRILEMRQKVWDLIDDQHAHVYICGNPTTMARDVHDCFVRIITEHCKNNHIVAEKYMQTLLMEGRYHREIWS